MKARRHVKAEEFFPTVSDELSMPPEVDALAQMSHELKTPLSAVLGAAHLMASDAEEPLAEGQKRRVRLIEEAGRHMLAYINEALDSARDDANPATTRPRQVAVPLRPLVNEVARLLQPLAARLGVKIVVEPIAAAVSGDAQRVRQILANVASNAVKYNRPGGEVRIGATVTDDRQWVRVDVSDTGIGMSPAMLGRLFLPYDRLGAETGNVEGTGIGLFISRRLVERIGGRIEVRSEPGLGSNFAVWMRSSIALPPIIDNIHG